MAVERQPARQGDAPDIAADLRVLVLVQELYRLECRMLQGAVWGEGGDDAAYREAADRHLELLNQLAATPGGSLRAVLAKLRQVQGDPALRAGPNGDLLHSAIQDLERLAECREGL